MWFFSSGDYLDSAQFNTVNLLQYNNRAYDRLTIRMLLERQPQFYLSKIVSGSMLLVYMCVWVFSLAVDEADRMMVRSTLMRLCTRTHRRRDCCRDRAQGSARQQRRTGSDCVLLVAVPASIGSISISFFFFFCFPLFLFPRAR